MTLEHPWILVFTVGLEPMTIDTKGWDDLFVSATITQKQPQMTMKWTSMK